MTTAVPTAPPATRRFPALARAAGAAWAVALAANVAVLAIATQLLDVDVVHPDPPGSDTLGDVTVGHVAVSTTVGTVLALLAAAAAARVVARPRRTFLAVAGLAAVASSAGPLTIEGASGGSTATLLAMHVITPLVLLTLLGRVLPEERAVR